MIKKLKQMVFVLNNRVLKVVVASSQPKTLLFCSSFWKISNNGISSTHSILGQVSIICNHYVQSLEVL